MSTTKNVPARCAIGRMCGFTLMELLVSLAITVLVGGIIGSALFTTFRAKDVIEATNEETRGVGLLGERIKEDLINAMPPTGIFAGPFIGDQAGGTDATAAGAKSDYIKFVASGGDTRSPVPGDMMTVEYYISSDPAFKDTLVRRVNTNLMPVDASEQLPEEPICRNVTSFTVMYFDGTTWSPQYQSDSHLNAQGLGMLPLAVAMTIEITEPNHPTQKIAVTVTLPCAELDDTTTGGF